MCLSYAARGIRSKARRVHIGKTSACEAGLPRYDRYLGAVLAIGLLDSQPGMPFVRPSHCGIVKPQ